MHSFFNNIEMLQYSAINLGISQVLNGLGGFVLNALKVILVLGFLIFIHELGHFIVAKWVGIKVHEFAIGFGPKFFSRQKGETLYSLRAIPMGGFVKMEGEEEASEDERAFNNKPIIARLAVVVTGPIMNIVLALVILITFVFYFGNYASTVVDEVSKGSGAETANVLPGDKVTKIDGQTMRIWDDIKWYMLQNGKRNVDITVLRNGRAETINVETKMQLNFDIDDKNVISGIDESSAL